MQKLLNTPIQLSENKSGFSVIDGEDLRFLIESAVVSHISQQINTSFSDIDEAARFIANNCFEKFKDKPQRILPRSIATSLVGMISDMGFCDLSIGEFITDEENLLYPNIYWRIVRPNMLSDVGPIHADRWFWDLSGSTFPPTHKRVKVWMPLLQNDHNPSLLVVPGSHTHTYTYGSTVDKSGKVRPTFDQSAVHQQLVPAPVKLGQAVVFNDSLLHGGQATDTVRVSVEWTLACKSRICEPTK
jgi:hypothetical protein